MTLAFGEPAQFALPSGGTGRYFSLPALESKGLGSISRLPVSLRIVLESLLRNCDGRRVQEADVRNLAAWKPNERRVHEVPFVVARVLLQDFTGVPLLVDLAAMRSAAEQLKLPPGRIEPLVPVDLVVDHSVQVDHFGRPDAAELNLSIEFDRNRKRYEFLKWGKQAFETFGIVPPGVGICHQVNLEYLGRGVLERDGVHYPDTLVGTDSHTTMINGLGIVGWGVGGIEAEAAMLGQPVYFLTPDVVGVHLTGSLRPGVTATDLVLRVTELLRSTKVVGKFVEFHGAGVSALSVPDRATIANMCPEYGATLGFFPCDEQTCRYLLSTGRSPAQVDTLRAYMTAQGMFGTPSKGQCDYSQVVELDLGTVTPAVAGPRRPQDRIDLPTLGTKFKEMLRAPSPSGYARSEEQIAERWTTALTYGGFAATSESERKEAKGHTLPADHEVITKPGYYAGSKLPSTGGDVQPEETQGTVASVGDGDVLIAAITSCTNTSNPALMLAAGLVAKKAVEKGLRPKPSVKTSLAPGSRVVTEYFQKTGLQPYLDQIGFHLIGYGCATCIGNSGPIDPGIDEVLSKHGVVAASVLSGNRNFEARIHQSIKANFLMSPPLVVAFALAGRVTIDLEREPIGEGKDGPVYLKDIWPSPQEIDELLQKATDPETYRKLYTDLDHVTQHWTAISSPAGQVYRWDDTSTYVRQPPYFADFKLEKGQTKVSDLIGARPLAYFGDSITTDHISPAGSIKASSPAGIYLQQHGVSPADFNSYGARRGNHEVMVRGTFANVRIKNKMVPGTEGGITIHQPSGERMSIYDAAMRYEQESVPLIILAGHEYGTGSSRDWAAKGTRLLGVRVVVARSFERIHRSNLVGMGVLPCEFMDETTVDTLGLDGSETFDLRGIDKGLTPGMTATLRIHKKGGASVDVSVKVRIDTPIEVEYFTSGGILPYVLRQLLTTSPGHSGNSVSAR